MQRLLCEACRKPPSATLRAGDACPRCTGRLAQHTRCPWCTRWALAPTCAACSAEILSLHDFGAARMLVDGGVDRYALPERVRALPRHQHAELSARFDAQWSALQIRIEEARWVDSHLLIRSLAAEVEDELIAALPLAPDSLARLTGGPRAPFDENTGLCDIADQSPMEPTRTMAAIALVHDRRARDQDVDRTRAMALHGDGAAADEAVLALGRWWVPTGEPPDGRESGYRTSAGWGVPSYERCRGRHSARRLDERARALLVDPELAPWAAVTASTLTAERADLEPALRAALGARNQDLRFAAALALPGEGEAELLRARHSSDLEMRARALRALAAAACPEVAADLAGGPDPVRREILRGLSTPLDARFLEALLAALATAGPDLRRDLSGFLRGRPFARLTDEERRLLAGWIGGGERGLPLALLLEMCGWALQPEGGDACSDPRDDAEVHPFVGAVTPALRAASPEQREQLLREQRIELARWLFAVPPPEAAPVLDAWVDDPLQATQLFQQLIQLHARLCGWGRQSDTRTLIHLFGLIDRAATDEALASSLAQALRAERGASGRDAIVAGLWQRFVDQPERRRAIAIAAEPLRQEMKELRRASGESGPFSPVRDPARFFAVMAAADPLDSPALAREAAEASEESGVPADLVAAVVDHIEPDVAVRPCTALWALANVASPAANWYRRHPDDAAAFEAVVELRRGWERLLPRLSALTPIDEQEARHAHLREQIETELRLVDEAAERLAEDRRRSAEADDERWRREADAERLRADLEAAVRAARDPSADTSWDEPVLPDQPLPTISAYARFLRALAAGGDARLLLRKHEISVEKWIACVEAWTTLLASRPDLALRFSRLYVALGQGGDA